jgi:hypothetical protein
MADLTAIWGSGPNDIWAMGSSGACIRWNGSNWSSFMVDNSTSISGLWGSSASDIWAVGGDTVLHWNGSAWMRSTAAPNVNLRSVWGSSASDVWAVGDKGTVLRYLP